MNLIHLCCGLSIILSRYPELIITNATEIWARFGFLWNLMKIQQLTWYIVIALKTKWLYLIKPMRLKVRSIYCISIFEIASNLRGRMAQ